MIEIFFKLLISHALCDYPLQGDFIAKFKSHKLASPVSGTIIWRWLLASHAAIHAGGVWLVTGSVFLALAEYTLHCMIDFAKSEGWINFHVDQLLHIICKAIWAFCPL